MSLEINLVYGISKSQITFTVDSRWFINAIEQILKVIDQIILLGDLNRKIKILDYGCGKKKLSSKLNYPLVYNYDLNQKYTEISSIENLKKDSGS